MKYRIRKRLSLGNEAGEAAYGIDYCKCHVSGHARRTLAAFAQRVGALEAGAL